MPYVNESAWGLSTIYIYIEMEINGQEGAQLAQ
jgi:hypothetical protein